MEWELARKMEPELIRTTAFDLYSKYGQGAVSRMFEVEGITIDDGMSDNEGLYYSPDVYVYICTGIKTGDMVTTLKPCPHGFDDWDECPVCNH